jgi:glycosyltransferase 2 family protein
VGNRALHLVRGLGLAVFFWLIYRVDWSLLSATLDGVNQSYLYVLPVFTVLMVALRTWRWALLLEAGRIGLGPLRAFSLYATGLFLGSFTPGRMGDMAKAFYLQRKYDVSWSRSISGTLLDRLFDLGVLLTVGAWSLGQFGLWDVLMPWIAAGVVIGLIFAVIIRRWARPRDWDRLRRHKIWQYIARCRVDVVQVARRAGLRAMLLTLMAYAVYFSQTVLLAEAVGLGLAPSDMVALIALIGLASFLPVSIAGLGTREGLLYWGLLMRETSESLERAMTYSGLFLCFCYLLPALLGGLCWLGNPLPFKDSSEEID